MAWRFSAAILGGISICVPAVVRTAHSMRDASITTIADVYEEQIAGQGLTPDGRLIELVLSENGSSTILVTTAPDVACVITAGTGWDVLQNDALDLPKFTHRMHL